jgi:hypothetical protein
LAHCGLDTCTGIERCCKNPGAGRIDRMNGKCRNMQASAVRQECVGSRGASRNDQSLPEPAGKLCGVGRQSRRLALVRNNKIDIRQQLELYRQRGRQI